MLQSLRSIHQFSAKSRLPGLGITPSCDLACTVLAGICKTVRIQKIIGRMEAESLKLRPLTEKTPDSAALYNDIRFLRSGRRVASHLGFQMCLYFNVWFFPAWLIVIIYSLAIKHHALNDILFGLTPVFVTLAIFLEAARLYFGYYGNLFENLPALGVFFLLSVLLQLPLIIIQVAVRNFLVETLEFAFDITLLVFIGLELVTGCLALRDISRVQSANAKLLLEKSKQDENNNL